MFVLLYLNVVGALEPNNVYLVISMVLWIVNANGTIMSMMGHYGIDSLGSVHGIEVLFLLITLIMIMEVHSDIVVTIIDHIGVEWITIQLDMHIE